jgi:3-methyladenine DNA glycosylase/8-oxoguanine DNA glycosylase
MKPASSSDPDSPERTVPTDLDDFAGGERNGEGESGEGEAADVDTPTDPYDHLRGTDLAPLVDRYGELDLSTRGDLFERLVVSIVRQLVSTERADRIVARLRERYEITPEVMLGADVDELRESGLSGRIRLRTTTTAYLPRRFRSGPYSTSSISRRHGQID